ncbi:hypothetical protein ElyMa_002155100 [Elysia marginata]|uniref:Uncharacterized protein n=1 Tax=Elysia marginata TaxID=1093978 RepID=A0AAV4FN35_9GAST|nr:hypothetical protein ElyMa_002155100 [Elysia marginata]
MRCSPSFSVIFVHPYPTRPATLITQTNKRTHALLLSRTSASVSPIQSLLKARLRGKHGGLKRLVEGPRVALTVTSSTGRKPQKLLSCSHYQRTLPRSTLFFHSTVNWTDVGVQKVIPFPHHGE